MVAAPGGPPAGLDPDNVWRDAVAYARWTPSAHNTQPWRIRVIAPRKADVLYDPTRLLPSTDPNGAFCTVGLSIFVEYLTVALQSAGFSVHTEYADGPLALSSTTLERFASLRLTPARATPGYDCGLLLKRQTSRLPYDGIPVEDGALRAMNTIADEANHRFGSSSDAGFVRWVLDLNRDTLFSDVSDASTRTELRRWLRYTEAQADASKDGLSSRCLNVRGSLLQRFFEDNAQWGNGWRATVAGNALLNSMRGTRTVAWWSGPFATQTDWIAAGRVLSRTWLELTRRGISLHPFGSVITNAGAHARLRDRLGVNEEHRPLWLLARLGRSATPPRSHRIAHNDLFVTGRSRS
jgi:hypothetical protein